MKLDQFFGLLLIILAIYLGVTATTRGSLGDGLNGGPDDGVVDGGGSGGGGGGDNGGGNGGGDAADEDGADQSGGTSAGGGEQEQMIASSDFCDAAPDSAAFTDVGPAHDEAIRCAVEADVMSGKSSTQFDPADAVSRADVAASVADMIDTVNDLEADDVDLQGLPDANDARFRDITDDSPHRQAIARLNETPILKGLVDARFEPNQNITRAQMASVLDRTYRYVNDTGLPNGPDQFRDDDPSVHEDSINAVAAADIMPGVSDERFAPEGSVRRGQLASYLTRMMVRMEQKGRIRPLP